MRMINSQTNSTCKNMGNAKNHVVSVLAKFRNYCDVEVFLKTYLRNYGKILEANGVRVSGHSALQYWMPLGYTRENNVLELQADSKIITWVIDGLKRRGIVVNPSMDELTNLVGTREPVIIVSQLPSWWDKAWVESREEVIAELSRDNPVVAMELYIYWKYIKDREKQTFWKADGIDEGKILKYARLYGTLRYVRKILNLDEELLSRVNDYFKLNLKV